MFHKPLQSLLERRLFTSGGRKVAFYTLAHSMYTLLAGGFEIALILRLTGSIERVVFMNLFMYLLLYLAFVAGSWLLRSGMVSRGFRLDLATQFLACAYMLAMFRFLDNSLVLVGFFLLKGLSEGLFWSTRHSALLHSVQDAGRDSWALKLQTVTIILSVCLPLASGFAISYLNLPLAPAPGSTSLPAGYWPVYALAACLALGALALSPDLRIPAQQFSLARAASLRGRRGTGDWVIYQVCGSIASVSATLAIGILNFHVLRTEFNMGLFASWIAVAGAVFYFSIHRLRRSQRLRMPRLRMVLLGSTGDVASRLLYWCFYSVPGLIGKSLLDSFIVPLRAVFGENIIRQRVELMAARHGLSVVEVILFQESVLLAARVAVCLALITILNILGGEAVSVSRLILGVFTAYGFIDFLFVRRIERGNARLRAAGPV